MLNDPNQTISIQLAQIEERFSTLIAAHELVPKADPDARRELLRRLDLSEGSVTTFYDPDQGRFLANAFTCAALNHSGSGQARDAVAAAKDALAAVSRWASERDSSAQEPDDFDRLSLPEID